MNSNLTNFNSWYASILANLYPNRDAGFTILMIAFPLLERYLREKTGVHEGDLNKDFHVELARQFPELGSDDVAKQFWQVYRNGLLHQVTISRQSRRGIRMPEGWVSNDVPPVCVDADGNFWVNPAKFSRRVVELIQSDFGTFEGAHSRNHELPYVGVFTPTVLGTAAPSAWQKSITGEGRRRRND